MSRTKERPSYEAKKEEEAKDQERIEIGGVTLGEQEIREDAKKLGQKSHGGASGKQVESVAAQHTCDSHNCGKDEPTGRPYERDIYLAVRVGKERRIVIEMSVGHEKWRLTLHAWKTQAEVISKTIRNSTQAKHAVSMREFIVNRVDIVAVVKSDEAAESCVA